MVMQHGSRMATQLKNDEYITLRLWRANYTKETLYYNKWFDGQSVSDKFSWTRQTSGTAVNFYKDIIYDHYTTNDDILKVARASLTLSEKDSDKDDSD
jgi:hypothetical protein